MLDDIQIVILITTVVQTRGVGAIEKEPRCIQVCHLASPAQVVLTNLYDSISSRYVTEETAFSHPRTPEPVAGPSKSKSFPTPSSGRVDSRPATTIQTTSALVKDVQSPSPVRFPKSPPDSPTYPRTRPLERENAFYGWEMLQRYDFVRSRNGKPSFVGTTIQALAPGSPDPQKPPSVAAGAAAPVPSTTAISGPSDPQNSEAAAVTRVTRSSARRNLASAFGSGSGGIPSSSPSSSRKGKKRPSDNVDANADSGAANLPPAKRRKKLPLKNGDTSK